MNAKIAASITTEETFRPELLNPFVHHLELGTTYEKIKTGLFTILLLPIRVVIICSLLIAGWLIAIVGLWGVPEENLREKPITGWRSMMRHLTCRLTLLMFAVGGFRLKVLGVRANRSEAAVVALAPHSSFIDAIALVYMGAPSIVAKAETANIPFFGTCNGCAHVVSKFSRFEAIVENFWRSTKLQTVIKTFCGIFGSTNKETQTETMIANVFTRKLTGLVCLLGKTTYTAGGLHMVIKGKQATRSEAPILVIAPHSTFFDGGIIYVTGFPSIIVRRESGANPYIGKLINFTQPVYVWRDDPDSRQNTIKEIINRATSNLDWPQILIFPEGTCTNRSCLITFKPGAFYPGVPIQPVCIRYPNKLDTVTWTWEGPSALKLLWLTLTQVYSYCEIEFLPVYAPSEAEKRDPKLFANNVRNVMAKALGIPVLDYTYDDCRLMTRAKEMNLPNATALVEVQKLRHRLGLDQSHVEDKLLDSSNVCKNCKRITLAQFAEYLNVSISNPILHKLFRYYDMNSTGVIDFREYLLGVLATSKNRNLLDAIKVACKIYDSSGVGQLSPEDFATTLNHTLAMEVDEANDVFQQIDKNYSNYITFENFKSYAEKKAEFASLFSLSKEEKFKSKNGDICPEYDKKIE